MPSSKLLSSPSSQPTGTSWRHPWLTGISRRCTHLLSLLKTVLLSFVSELITCGDHSLSHKCNSDLLDPTPNETMHLLEQQLWGRGQSEAIGQHGILPNQLVLVYTLQLNGLNESKLFRCEKYNRIRFTLGPSLYGRQVSLFTNYIDDYKNFERTQYTVVDIHQTTNLLQLNSSGSFHFYYTELNKPENILGSFYLVVSPELIVKDVKTGKDQVLSVNAIQCQTVLSKCMGSIDTWKDKLKVSIESQYNMIHWTPIQELGGSKSAYSLADQHRVNQNFRSEKMKESKVDCNLTNVVAILDWLREEHGVLSITDIVLNHTANESRWLAQHPEAAYNCTNSPWLAPSFLLDRLLWHLTLDIEDGRFVNLGLTQSITSEKQLDTIRHLLHTEYLPLVSIEEFYLADTNKVLEEFEQHLIRYIYGKSASTVNAKVVTFPFKSELSYSPITLKQDVEYRRRACSVDFDNAILFIMNQVEFKETLQDEESVKSWIDVALMRFKQELIKINDQKTKEIKDHLACAVENVLKGAYYERLDPSGPKVATISKETPLTTQYFTDDINVHCNKDLIQIEQSLYDKSKACFYMAHNGWVMGDDPLRNFAERDSWVYLRRELICWGDSVKLRYGQSPEDSPFLWKFMEEYVKQMATTFQGLRLDNCHSTPIHVAQHMIDMSRRANPNLYLVAELFTSNENIDNIFINKLGINSLIREAMSASIPFELGRQVYRFGGEPVGSFLPDNIRCSDDQSSSKPELYARPLVTSVAHAILFDQTHDNESPVVTRTAHDPLPTAALVAMTYAATGSNRGLDELVPHHINVVHEDRQYSSWDESGLEGVNINTGIIGGKQVLNRLHLLLNTLGYSQSFVDQRDRDTIVVTRHNPFTHRSVVLVSRTAFFSLNHHYPSSLQQLRIEGKFEHILFEMTMTGNSTKDFNRNLHTINGLTDLSSNVILMNDSKESNMVEIAAYPTYNQISFKQFPPSSVIALSFSLLDHQMEALFTLQHHLKQYDQKESDIVLIVDKLDLIDLNYALFRSDREEMDEFGSGVYNLSTGPLTYCGFAGVMYQLAMIRTHNDLGHPLCANLRDGNWLPDYIVQRLKRRQSTLKLANWLEAVFEPLSHLPRYLIPRYFDAILSPLYSLLLDRVWALSSDYVRQGDNFLKRLALGGVALIGSHAPSPLAPLVPRAVPSTLCHFSSAHLPTIAAGLPHFASGYMRNWGRDTFISLKGLSLLTGRYDVAKITILGYAGTLRHGLIPNLLDGGCNSRFNCRDAVWWWLKAIVDYIQTVPNGYHILSEPVRRIFPTDHSVAGMDDTEFIEEPLYKTMQEALERHFKGIDFIERNAGSQIDEHMNQEGFHVQIMVDRQTGFVRGGNQWNCGTWMDKMGSSTKAGNRGRPATPRDGAAVEIVALVKLVVSFLANLYQKGHYPYSGVSHCCDSSDKVYQTWTYEEWSRKIQDNFETHFYVATDSTQQHINRRAIYKDSYGASFPWMDYQLRPNILIAMCVAPELFNREHALGSLSIVHEVLLGPLGIKTLDPSDWNYRGDYDNSNDSDDSSVARGFNYHNGPEWLWPVGYYWMACLKFNTSHSAEVKRVNCYLAKHFDHLTQSSWFGLPELTNSNASPCRDSCPIQAWSHATLIELLHLKHTIEKSLIFD